LPNPENLGGGAPDADITDPGSQSKPLQRPERRFTILLLATAITFGLAESVVGSLFLAHLAGVPTDLGLVLFPSHPYVQIFGFVAEFVTGVAYSLLPRFKAGPMPRMSLAYMVYASMTGANVIFALIPFLESGSPLLPVASLLMLVAALLFAYQVTIIASRPTGGFPEANPLIILSSVSLVLMSVLLFFVLEGVAGVGGDVFSPQMVLLALLGFAGSEIYAVQVRSVSFRQCDYRGVMVRLATILQGTAIAAVFVDALAPSQVLSVTASSLFLAAAVSVLLSTKVLELAHPLMLRPAMTKMHYTIMRYNEVCILSAAVWLLIGCGLAVLWSGFGVESFFVRDSAIHSIAIGFVGSDITCFAPMLLPGLLGRKGPVTGLSFGPIAVLDLGLFVRIAGNFQSVGSVGLPSWESLSGPLVIVAMVWFLIMLKRVGVRRPIAAPQPKTWASEEFPVGRMDELIDVQLSVAGSTVTKPSPVWFVEKRGALYALPSKGEDTPWYREIQKQQEVSISFKGMTLKGKATPMTEAGEVKKIGKMFKDKYGQRNFENYVGRGANVGVKIVLQDPKTG
jgi:hypothetical protein